MSVKWRALAVLITAQVLGMSLWFSASAVREGLQRDYELTPLWSALLTSGVSAGFVIGTLVSAVLGLADRLDPRRLFALSTLIAAAANAAALIIPADSPAALLARLTVGAASAGIYPVGMKLAASWAGVGGRQDSGLLIGLLVGALTLGSATPWAIGLAGGLDWRAVIAGGSVLALLGAAVILFFTPGPRLGRATAFRARDALTGLRDPALRLVNLGYLGHMWELYAMWGWIGAFYSASFAINPGGPNAALLAKAVTFAVIAIGAMGCLAGGVLADRWGRTRVTSLAMVISGAAALASGLLFAASPVVLIIIGLVWGFAVIADSAQFSAAATELAPPELTGTMLTVQTCQGFLLTIFTIQLTPVIVEAAGWAGALAFLALGPFAGALAMLRLRRLPAALRLAGGQK